MLYVSKLLLGFSFLAAASVSAQTTYFQQNFSGGTALTDYYTAAPGSDKFTDIRGSEAKGLHAQVIDGALEFDRSIDDGDASFSRIADFSPPPTSLYVQFSVEVLSSNPASPNNNALIFFIGQGFTNGPANPSNANTYARLGINLLASGSGHYSYNSYPAGGGGEVSGTLTGKHTVTMVLNHTGSSLPYVTPGGGTENQPNDVFDVWVDGNKIFDDKPVVSASAAMTDFKMMFEKSIAKVRFDDLLIRDISGALPLWLVSFDGKADSANQVKLTWQTVGLPDIRHFEVQRRTDGQQFETIGTVETGTTAKPRQTYTFIDHTVPDGKLYYRLGRTDADGYSVYSQPIAVEPVVQPPMLLVTGNPVTDGTIRFRVRHLPQATYRLVDAVGKPVAANCQSLPNETLQLSPVFSLLPGIYFLEVQNNTRRLVEKIVVY